MKLQVRTGVFETNSSSTHSMAICTQTDFDAFKNGNKFVSVNSLKLYDSVEEGMKNEEWEDKENFKTYDEYDEYISEWYEQFEERFTTPSGDKMIAFGYHGYNG